MAMWKTIIEFAKKWRGRWNGRKNGSPFIGSIRLDEFGDALVMAAPPSPDCTVEQMRQMAAEDDSEETLAAVYAYVSNKTIWIYYKHDEEEEWPPEVEQECDVWEQLEEELRARIFQILKNENEVEYERTVNEKRGYHNIIKPFMLRNGFRDGRGWWVR